MARPRTIGTPVEGEEMTGPRTPIPGSLAAAALLALLLGGASAAAALPADRKLPAEQLARHIDRLINRKLAQEKVTASPRCSDEEFLRRVHLDITGKVPSGDAAIAFLDSKEPDKRARLIDELLAGKDYGRHFADVWQALLLPRSSDSRFLMRWYPNLTTWLQQQFNEGASWDKIARGVLTASGAVDKQGPAVYWLANGTPDRATDNVTRLFLGVQLQCAQCHNHPFTDFKQDEYWHLAAFFLKVGPDGNVRRAVRNGGTITISERPRPARRRGLPDSAKVLPPKFLQGEKAQVKPGEPLRPVLADWMTSPKNPYFARAMVNRTWALFFGRGIVNPVDDMHDGNLPSHPELLADLSRQFVAGGFDVKHLVRAITLSQTYQRGSKPKGNNADAGPELYARMAVRPLTPGQLYDSLTQLVGAPANRPAGRRAGAARFGFNPREAFVTFFSAEDGADPTEYQDGIPQVLRLMNGPQLNNARLLGPILRDSKGQGELIEKLYLTVLARRPRSEEVARIDTFLARNKDNRRQALAGVLWALMNSSEFRVNR
jgi:hypothetical protein